MASPDNTIIRQGGSFIDSQGNTWGIDSNAQVTVNGQLAGFTSGVTEMAFEGGSVWQENNQNLWWEWNPAAPDNNTGWSPSAGTPTPPSGVGPHPLVTFQGPEADYTIQYLGKGTANVTDSVPSRDDSVASISEEVLQFSDQPYFIESGDHANIARLYSAGLGHPPDPKGLFGWEDIYDHNVSAAAKAQGVYVSLAETPAGFNGDLSIADGIIDSNEFAMKYGPPTSLSNEDFVTLLYQNVLGRAPATGELNGWLNLMTSGDANGIFTRGMVLVGFAESPENIGDASRWMTDMSRSG
jgi:hypothetical protein